MSTTSNFEKLAVIQIDFDIWSGQTKLDKADINVGMGGRLPDAKVADLGRKHVANPESLKVFQKIKQRVRRYLDGVGKPFMGGWGVPASDFPQYKRDLDNFVAEFHDEVTLFLNNYEQQTEAWIRDNPDDADIIRRSLISKDKVKARFGFIYKSFRIQPLGEDDADALDKELGSLGEDLLGDVCQEADDSYLKYFAGKSFVNKTTGKTLKNLRNKVFGLSFLNGNLKHVVDLFDQALQVYETATQKHIAGDAFYRIMAVLLILADPKRLKDYADGRLVLDSYASDLAPAKPALAVTTEEVILSDGYQAVQQQLMELDQDAGGAVSADADAVEVEIEWPGNTVAAEEAEIPGALIGAVDVERAIPSLF